MKATLFFCGKTSTGLFRFRSDRIFGFLNTVCFRPITKDVDRPILASANKKGTVSSYAFGETGIVIKVDPADAVFLEANCRHSVNVELETKPSDLMGRVDYKEGDL